MFIRVRERSVQGGAGAFWSVLNLGHIVRISGAEGGDGGVSVKLVTGELVHLDAVEGQRVLHATLLARVEGVAS